MSCLSSEEHLSCTACSLAAHRTQVVGGHGDRGARVALVGEAPGREEDEQGWPFVGPAGRHLQRLVEEAGLDWDHCWRDNTIHCRPPDNRIEDYPNSLITCPPLWLLPTLRSLPNLAVIVALGATAGNLFFPGRRAHELSLLIRAYRPSSINCSSNWLIIGAYHPSYALRKWSENADTAREIDEEIRKALRLAVELS